LNLKVFVEELLGEKEKLFELFPVGNAVCKYVIKTDVSMQTMFMLNGRHRHKSTKEDNIKKSGGNKTRT